MEPKTTSLSHPKPTPKRFIRNPIPSSILTNPSLNAAIALLPPHYNFEIHKTVHRALSLSARRVALQFPDGLLLFALPIADILLAFANVDHVLVLADPTYGACCVEDLAAAAVGADLLVHYGHSCLVPVGEKVVPTLYVFVDVRIDAERLVDAVKCSVAVETPLALAGTIQFNSAVHVAKSALASAGYDVVVPQAKPLSAGEVLGCTAPRVGKKFETVVFVADGRFHMEAFMIVNPGVRALRYDPYQKVMFSEEYDSVGMKEARKKAILDARGATSWGIVLGTLGRQGSTRVLDRVERLMEERGLEWTVVLMSEISPTRMALFQDSVDAWVQIACPRLSIDWGEAFERPLLTTFEFEVALGFVPGWWERNKAIKSSNCKENVGKQNEVFGGCKDGSCGCSCENGANNAEEELDYPMDYYAQDGGEWNSSRMKKKFPQNERKPVSRVGAKSS